MCLETNEHSQIKPNVKNPKQIKVTKRKRTVNRRSFNSEEFISQCSLSKCNVLIKTKSDCEKDIHNENGDCNRKCKRRIPKTIIENGFTYDNDELIDYDDNNWGIIFENTAEQMNSVEITKDIAVQTVRTAVKQYEYVEGQITKRVTEKQTEIIGNIIYEVVNGIIEYDISKPIVHPDLKYVRVRVSVNPLTDEYKKENCYKDKDITNKEFIKAKRQIEKGIEPNDIKVLSIQIC